MSFERSGENACAAAPKVGPSTMKSSISRFAEGYSSGKHSCDGWVRSANSSRAANCLIEHSSRLWPTAAEGHGQSSRNVPERHDLPTSAPQATVGDCHCQIKAVARRCNHQHESYAEDHSPKRGCCATCRA